MLMTQLMRWTEGRIGTSVELPLHAIELYLPSDVFTRLGADGYCIDRHYIDEFISVVGHVKLRRSAADAVETAYKTMAAAPDNVTHIIVCTTQTVHAFHTTLLDHACLHRSLINHERFHALTMRRTKLWHTLADCILERELGDVWTQPRDAMLQLTTYASMISSGTDESWLAATEMLARVAAVLHAPKTKRDIVARYQLETDPVGLIVLAEAIREHWSSAEGSVGWLDGETGRLNNQR